MKLCSSHFAMKFRIVTEIYKKMRYDAKVSMRCADIYSVKQKGMQQFIENVASLFNISDMCYFIRFMSLKKRNSNAAPLIVLFFYVFSALCNDCTYMIVCQGIEYGFTFSAVLDQLILFQNSELV